MDLRTVQRTFLVYQQQLRNGSITKQQFQDKVAALTVTGKDGSVWRIAEDGAGWLKQQGDGWQRSPGPPPMPPRGLASCNTLAQLVAMMAKGMAKKLPVVGVKVAAIAGGVWILQTYLGMGSRIVWWNQTHRYFRTLLGAGADPFWQWVFWLMLSSLVVATIAGIRAHGPRRFFGRIGAAFSNLGDTYRQTGSGALPPLLIGAAVAMIVTSSAGLRLFNLTAALSITLGLTSPQGLQFLVPKLAWSDIGRLLKRTTAEPDRDLLVVAYFGFILAATAAFLLPILMTVGYWVALALIIGTVVLMIRSRQVKPGPQDGETT